YGGGVQSTAMLVLAARKEIDFSLALFSNVGDDSEHPDTIDYVNTVAVPYARDNGIDLVELRRKPRGKERSLYQELIDPNIRSVSIPVYMDGGGPGNRKCTIRYKIERIASYLKTLGATEESPAH